MRSHLKHVQSKTKRIPKELQEDFCEQTINQAQSFLRDSEKDIKIKNDQIKKLQKSIKELLSINFIFHPIKKYKQYKRLLEIYYNIK